MRDSLPCPDEQHLQQWCARLAPMLRATDAITLSGVMGAGKTTCVRYLLAALCAPHDPPEVTSPTFCLMQSFEVPHLGTVWHADLHRLDEDALAWYGLGLDEFLGVHLCLIEWPELARNHLPEDTLHLEWAWGDTSHDRILHWSGTGRWQHYHDA